MKVWVSRILPTAAQLGKPVSYLVAGTCWRRMGCPSSSRVGYHTLCCDWSVGQLNYVDPRLWHPPLGHRIASYSIKDDFDSVVAVRYGR